MLTAFEPHRLFDGYFLYFTSAVPVACWFTWRKWRKGEQ